VIFFCILSKKFTSKELKRIIVYSGFPLLLMTMVFTFIRILENKGT